MLKALSVSEEFTGTHQSLILVVDDEANVRCTIAEILRQKGHQVEEASNGQEALRLLERLSFDLMIVDMLMPGMSGVEVMLRARLMRRDLALIVLTAHANVDSAIAAVRADVADYLTKPCKAEDLLLTVARTLEARANQLQNQRLLGMVGQAMTALHLQNAEASVAPTAPARVEGEDLLRIGVLAVDRAKRAVTLKTNPPRVVELTEGEMSILLTLMQKPNQVMTCAQLAKAALGYEGMDKWTVESVVRSTVFRLRQKIEAGSDAPQLIRTVRGRGYFFAPA